jgi:hypothetical protein
MASTRNLIVTGSLRQATSRGIMHTISPLVDAQPQSPTDLLAPARDVFRIGSLEHSDRKYVRIIPTFPQGGVRKNEPNRLLKTEQLRLPPQDQLVSVHAVGGPFCRARVN